MRRIPCYILAVLCLSMIVSSCTKIKDLFDPPTPRERYQREFGEDEVSLMLWDHAYQRALEEDVSVQLPYGEAGFFMPDYMLVYSYETDLRQGEVFHFDLLTEDP